MRSEVLVRQVVHRLEPLLDCEEVDERHDVPDVTSENADPQVPAHGLPDDVEEPDRPRDRLDQEVDRVVLPVRRDVSRLRSAPVRTPELRCRVQLDGVAVPHDGSERPDLNGEEEPHPVRSVFRPSDLAVRLDVAGVDQREEHCVSDEESRLLPPHTHASPAPDDAVRDVALFDAVPVEDGEHRGCRQERDRERNPETDGKGQGSLLYRCACLELVWSDYPT